MTKMLSFALAESLKQSPSAPLERARLATKMLSLAVAAALFAPVALAIVAQAARILA